MDRYVVAQLIRLGKLSTAEVVEKAAVVDLDGTVAMLKRFRGHDEVRAALMQRTAKAAKADFEKVNDVFLKHFG